MRGSTAERRSDEAHQKSSEHRDGTQGHREEGNAHSVHTQQAGKERRKQQRQEQEREEPQRTIEKQDRDDFRPPSAILPRGIKDFGHIASRSPR